MEDDFQIDLPDRYITPYYSLNGTDWVELQAGEQTPAINTGDKIYVKGNLEKGMNGVGSFSTEQRFNLSGNCMSLIFGDEAEGKTDLTGYNGCFYYLFQDCTGLEHVSPNFLPATTLANKCYGNMFAGCTSLVTIPELPAITLAEGCYDSMFKGCISLMSAPELPATTLINSCYANMFNNCSSLNYIKALFLDEPTYYNSLSATYSWVRNVSPTGTFVMSKDATWNPEDYKGVRGEYGIPKGWNVEFV